MTTILRFLLLSILSVASCGSMAQTSRVNIGTGPSGSVSFIEVYEYDYVTEKPTFPGGDVQLIKFINDTRQYPRRAYERGVQGRVTCTFVVDTDGSVCHLSVIRGVEPSLNKEALRVLGLMPDWQPGKLHGQPVPTRVVWSVPFRK